MRNKFKKYQVSEFVKEDLPTWNEIYYDFLVKDYNDSMYIPDEDKDNLDKYWKIPKKLFILATVCNQLNKMVEEDNIVFPDITTNSDRYVSEIPLEEVEDLSFLLSEAYEPVDIDEDKPYIVPIYTLKHPKGYPNPFIKHNKRRINIDKFLDKNTVIVMRYNIPHHNGTQHVYVHNGCEVYKTIIDSIFKEVIDYYTDGVGWKDNSELPIYG